MTISVIIPTKYRYEDLLNTIKSINLQTCLPDEIIIIDQNISSDVKNAVLSLFNSVDEIKKDNIALKYIHDPQITGLTQARNRGIEENESDIVLFLDDDVILTKDFIFQMLEIFRRYPEIYGVSGIITNVKMGFMDYIIYRIFFVGGFTDKRALLFTNLKYRDVEYVPVSKLSGGLTGYRKEIFQEYKFDENYIKYSLSEDVDFSFRVSKKYKLVITPRAKLIHVGSSVGKADYRKHIESSILGLHYFLKKNLEKNIYNYLCFLWVVVGLLFNALISMVFNRNMDMLKGIIQGLRKVVMREDSDYVQSSKKKRNMSKQVK